MTDASNIARFTGNTEKARDHVTLSVEVLARKMAEAHEVGYRSGLNDARASDWERLRLMNNHHYTFETRVNLYIAMWDALMASGDPIAPPSRSA